jgi:nitronate monooxygenase
VTGLPTTITARLRLPVIAAPMLRVSGLDLVDAACRAGVIGAFPVANAGGLDVLADWMTRLAGLPATAAPWCPNLIMRHPRVQAHADLVAEHGAEIVITSVGSPVPVLERLHRAGTIVLADVATLEHARKALDGGADGLVLLSAGAGGQTGWMNPFAFVRAVRDLSDGPVVLAGGIADGVALRAAIALGADLASVGTRFIAARESLAAPDYRDMLVAADLDDVVLTRAFTGLPTSMLRPAIRAAGLDPDHLDETVTPAEADVLFGGRTRGFGPKRWQDVYSAGHSVSGVAALTDVEGIVADLAGRYQPAVLPGQY